jgi:hypothetical protein
LHMALDSMYQFCIQSPLARACVTDCFVAELDVELNWYCQIYLRAFTVLLAKIDAVRNTWKHLLAVFTNQVMEYVCHSKSRPIL